MSSGGLRRAVGHYSPDSPYVLEPVRRLRTSSEHLFAEFDLMNLGYPMYVVFWVGVLTLAIATLYVIPQTAVLGAILLTGLLGGAIATHLRVGRSLITCCSASILG